MSKKVRFLVVFVLTAVSLVCSAQATGISPLWKNRGELLRGLAEQGELAMLQKQLGEWRDDFEYASCQDQMVWLKFAASYTEGIERKGYLSELRQRRACVEPNDAYYVNTILGAEDYEAGRFDSAYYSFTSAFEAARNSADTNHMVLALSNLAALYSELNWKVEALATALRAYSISRASEKVSDRTKLYLNNNVAGLQLDLGYYERARSVLEDYEVEELLEGDEEINVLRAVNYVRILIHDAKGNLKKVKKALDMVSSSSKAWVMASSFAAMDSACTPEVRSYVHDEYVNRWSEFVRDTAVLIDFGCPALGAIAVHQRVDESLRLRASELRNWASELPIGQGRLSYMLAMAQMFKSPDYWQEYWEELQLVEARDRRYAELQNDVIWEFNQEVELELSAMAELSRAKLLVRSLIGVASSLLAAAIALLLWVNRRYRKSLRNHRVFVADHERMAKEQVVLQSYMDELKAVVRKSGKTIKSELVEDVLLRMDRDRPSSAFELPPQFVKDYDLTPTEAKVLLQLAFGYRNSEIAQMLNISKSYIHNLRSKLRAKLPLKPDEELEDYAAALRKSYEPTTKPADSRTSA